MLDCAEGINDWSLSQMWLTSTVGAYHLAQKSGNLWFPENLFGIFGLSPEVLLPLFSILNGTWENSLPFTGFPCSGLFSTERVVRMPVIRWLSKIPFGLVANLENPLPLLYTLVTPIGFFFQMVSTQCMYLWFINKTAVNISIYMPQAHLRVNVLSTVLWIVFYFYYLYM